MAESQLTFSFGTVKAGRRSYCGAANPNWKGGPFDKVCVRCGEGFRVKYANRKARFCTIECFNLWQKETGAGKGKPKKPRVRIECLQCGKAFHVQPSWVGRRKFCQRKCHLAWRSARMALGGNPMWDGGLSRFPYPPDWNMERRKIVARDGGRCQNPLCWGVSSRINVHHIDYDKDNLAQANLITLCASCNGRANANRPWWEAHYKSLMGARGIV